MAASEPGPSSAARAVSYFSVLVLASLIAAGHELFVRQLGAYASAGTEPALGWLWGGSAAAFAAGFFAARAFRGDPRPLFSGALALLSVWTAASAPLLFFAFPSPWFGLSELCVALPAAALIGAALFSVGRFITQSASLFQLPVLVDPLRAALFVVVLGGIASAAALIGMLRAALALAMVLGALAFWSVVLFEYLDRVRVPRGALFRYGALASFALSAAALLACERFLPLADTVAFDGAILYRRSTPRQSYVVTSNQGTLQLFVDRALRVSSMDEHRYFEALVQPAMGSAESRRRVLLLGPGDGMAEREILRHDDVESLTVVSLDLELSRLTADVGFLRERAGSALSDARLERVQAEAIVWLRKAHEHFDVILADLSDPVSYVEGKYYTRYFYQLLEQRLARGGIAAIQATSPLDSPETFAGIGATLAAAGLVAVPYHAGIPSLGEWGFYLAAERKPGPPRFLPEGLKYLSLAAIPSLFHLPFDLRPRSDPTISTLDQQTAVETYERERLELGY